MTHKKKRIKIKKFIKVKYVRLFSSINNVSTQDFTLFH